MPRATINIGEPEGQAAAGALWRYAIGYVPGAENEGLAAQSAGSPARLSEYDDSGWAVCRDLAERVFPRVHFRLVPHDHHHSRKGGRARHGRDAGPV